MKVAYLVFLGCVATIGFMSSTAKAETYYYPGTTYYSVPSYSVPSYSYPAYSVPSYSYPSYSYPTYSSPSHSWSTGGYYQSTTNYGNGSSYSTGNNWNTGGYYTPHSNGGWYNQSGYYHNEYTPQYRIYSR